MNNTRKPNAMLIELVIVILFFAISAGIILQLFVAASNKSLQSGVDSAALLMVEDVLERASASELATEDFFAEQGFAPDGDSHVLAAEVNGRKVQIIATPEEAAETDAGQLDMWTVKVQDGERTAVSLPLGRYLPKEVTQ